MPAMITACFCALVFTVQFSARFVAEMFAVMSTRVTWMSSDCLLFLSVSVKCCSI